MDQIRLVEQGLCIIFEFQYVMIENSNVEIIGSVINLSYFNKILVRIRQENGV